MVLIMSVNPGFGGQTFLREVLPKIKALREMALAQEVKFEIEVDGGINLSNVAEVLRAGADVVVSGTSIFAGDIEENITQFRTIFNDTWNK
jgi:ribulose-phosphate 3-epimerase